MEIKVRGNFKAVGAKREWADGFVHKMYVDLDKDGKYPTIGEFEVFNNKPDLSKLKAGDEIDVSFNIKGQKREWEDKKTGKKLSGFFQALTCWKIEAVEGAPATPNAPAASDDEDTDSLPF